MIFSFRTTVTLWLEQIMQGDLYISEESFRSTRMDTALDPQVLELLQSLPLVESAAIVRAVTVESQYGPVDLIASDAWLCRAIRRRRCTRARSCSRSRLRTGWEFPRLAELWNCLRREAGVLFPFLGFTRITDPHAGRSV
jgi:hypothetical protein